MATKREKLLDLLRNKGRWDYVPAGFFLHFGSAYQTGQAAMDKHAEYFRATDMDFVKIQMEVPFPRMTMNSPADWANLPVLGQEFFGPQLEVVKGLVDALGNQALVVCTLYSPFMFLAHVEDAQKLNAHLHQDPSAVRKGIDKMTESLLFFVREAARLGLDGFYHSTQGGESHRFDDPSIFTSVIKPTDLELMKECERLCPFNILHICDYHRSEYDGYANLSPFLDYPGTVVNCSLDFEDRHLTGKEIAMSFGRPFMGGVDRLGPLSKGSTEDAREAARQALAIAPDRYILGADCTVPGDTSWENLRAAIDEAHAAR